MRSYIRRSIDWNDPESKTAYDKEYYEANRPKILQRKREIYQITKKMRLTLIERLGGRCVRCTTQVALEIDHINGGGKAHRSEFKTYRGYLEFLMALSQEELERDYQALCKPHNLEKYAKTGK